MPLLSDPPLDSETTRALAALGRALYIACEFESDCRSLAFVFKLKEPQPNDQSDEQFFEAVGKVVLGRLVDLNQLITKRAKLPEDYAAMLHAARDARNYVAHEAADELTRLAKVPDGVGQWRQVLATKLQDIALGKIIVAVLLSRNSAEPTPTKEVINAYRRKVESWTLRSDA
ncbi:hypothetical protein LJR034_009038 [Caballeronia sp. LjRoot34]|uniref:hypothetical protein n=1 Tax=Caballeronia sp. LjRoot34 TaxID=3342325 RepID=UPI003ED01EDE